MSELIKSESFEQRLFEKIRTDIGALMTDVELKKLVETSIERVFFSPREVVEETSYYGRKEKVSKAPEIYSVVSAAVNAQVTPLVKTYIEEHSDQIGKIIEECLAKGYIGLITNYLTNRMEGPLQLLGTQLNSLMSRTTT